VGDTVTIRVPEEVARKLEEIKKSLRLKTVGDAARIMFDLGESPLALIAIIFDLRNDVKQLLEQLKKLNQNLEKIMH